MSRAYLSTHSFPACQRISSLTLPGIEKWKFQFQAQPDMESSMSESAKIQPNHTTCHKVYLFYEHEQHHKSIISMCNKAKL